MAKDTIIEIPHMDIHGRQPKSIVPGAVEIEVGISLNGKHVQLIFPHRLEPIEGIGLSKMEALALSQILVAKAEMLKG